MLMTRSRFRYFNKLAHMFPDQPGLKRYYLRDCLAPRFGQLFIEQAIKAAESKTAYREELLDNSLEGGQPTSCESENPRAASLRLLDNQEVARAHPNQNQGLAGTACFAQRTA